MVRHGSAGPGAGAGVTLTIGVTAGPGVGAVAGVGVGVLALGLGAFAAGDGVTAAGEGVLAAGDGVSALGVTDGTTSGAGTGCPCTPVCIPLSFVCGSLQHTCQAMFIKPYMLQCIYKIYAFGKNI